MILSPSRSAERCPGEAGVRVTNSEMRKSSAIMSKSRYYKEGPLHSKKREVKIIFHTVPKFTLRMMTYGPQTFKKLSILSLKLVILLLFSQPFKKYRTLKNCRVGVLL